MSDRRGKTDGALLDASSTEAGAFEEFYLRHETVVAGYFMRRTGDAELAADLTAETFATALVNARRFRGDDGSPAIGWLLGIANHLLLQHWRDDRTRRRMRERLAIQEIVFRAESLDHVADLAGNDPGNALLRALEALPASQREAIKAHVLDEQPYDVVARRLGVHEPAIRQRVSRGLRRLRIAIQGELS